MNAQASRRETMRRLATDLQPLCRSISGDGVRRTLARIGELIPLEVSEVATGTPVLDWTVPREWNIGDAWIAGPDGRRLVDFRENPLHVVGYSVPVRERIRAADLRERLHLHAERGEWIPYRTSYWEETWGFCVTREQLDEIEADPDAELEVCIESSLEDGHLTYAEALVPGEDPAAGEILIVAHVCHPFMGNDNLSGIAVATELCRELSERPPGRHPVRFLFAPGTIGAITWIAHNRERTAGLYAGLTLTCIGDERPLTYKKTYRGDDAIDRAARHVLAGRGEHHVVDFSPYGYDERQFNAPGFRAPVGSLMRGRHGEFPEYHSSADDLELVRDESLVDAVEAIDEILSCLQRNRTFLGTEPFGEPQLGRRGVYRSLGGTTLADLQLAVFWVLAAADGETDLLAVAERSGLAMDTIHEAATLLKERGLLVEAE